MSAILVVCNACNAFLCYILDTFVLWFFMYLSLALQVWWVFSLYDSKNQRIATLIQTLKIISYKWWIQIEIIVTLDATYLILTLIKECANICWYKKKRGSTRKRSSSRH